MKTRESMFFFLDVGGSDKHTSDTKSHSYLPLKFGQSIHKMVMFKTYPICDTYDQLDKEWFEYLVKELPFIMVNFLKMFIHKILILVNL